MVIRKLKTSQFERIHKQLLQRAYTEPLDPSYTVNMSINGISYMVKVQPEYPRSLAVLQALRVDREDCGPNFSLVTENNLLSALLEILICQGVQRTV